jgi:hypothetical protein
MVQIGGAFSPQILLPKAIVILIFHDVYVFNLGLYYTIRGICQIATVLYIKKGNDSMPDV